MSINWGNYRRHDGSIDLDGAFAYLYGAFNLPAVGDAIDYIQDVEKLSPRIHSCECAAIVIRTAYEIARKP